MSKRPRQNTAASKQPFKKPRMASQPAKQAPPSKLFAASKKQGPELKNIDISGTISPAQASATFPVLEVLNVVAQGTTAETRIGRKIVIKSLDVRWQAALGLTSVGGSPIRFLIVYDRQTNAALPVATDVLATNTYLSQMNLANSERFVILGSWCSEPLSVNNNFTVSGQFYKQMALEVVFNDTDAGTVADIQTGGIFIMASQTGNITTAGPVASYISRIRFEDA